MVMKSHRISVVSSIIVLFLAGLTALVRRQPAPPPLPPVAEEVASPTNYLAAIEREATNQLAVPTARTSARNNPRSMPLQLMKDSLDLTEDQAKQLEPILKEQQAKIAALRLETSLSRQDRLARVKDTQQASDAQIKSVLTPEQAEKWRQRGQNLRAGFQPSPDGNTAPVPLSKP